MATIVLYCRYGHVGGFIADVPVFLNPISPLDRQWTKLHEASGSGDLLAVLALIGKGANIEAKDSVHATFLTQLREGSESEHPYHLSG